LGDATDAEDDPDFDSDTSSSDTEEDHAVPQEVNQAIYEADNQLAYFTKKIERAKSKLKVAKQARGYYRQVGATSEGRRPPAGRDSDRIRKLKAKSHCGACGAKGHWRGDDECPEKNNPSAVAPPRPSKAPPKKPSWVKASSSAHITQAPPTEPNQAHVTFASPAAPAGPPAALNEALSSHMFFLDSKPAHQVLACFTFATGMIYINLRQLIDDSGGKLTFDSAC
jgi:hypothetical protein